MTTETNRVTGLNAAIGMKPPVIAATTANITLSGEQTIDGVSVVAEDRVLVKDQTDASENGIYIASAGAWTRATDFDGSRDAISGVMVAVSLGTVSATSAWMLTTADPFTIGTSDLTFEQVGTISGDAVTLTGAQTLTNKTLTAPVIARIDGSGGVVDLHGTPGTISLRASSTYVDIQQYLRHSGNTANFLAFGTDTQDFQTGGASRMDISDSGVRFGAANARVTTVLDEDAMGSDSATALATQQSIKAYVDTNTSKLTRGTAAATTSGTEIDWSSLPAGQTRVALLLEDVSLSGTANLLVQLGTGGGIVSTGYKSSMNLTSASYGSSTSGFLISWLAAAAETFDGIVYLELVDATDHTWAYSALVKNSGDNLLAKGAGTVTLSAELTTVRLTTTNGTDTFDNGKANVNYE